MTRLRDWLLSSLNTLRLADTREYDLHVLVSSPRKHMELYPFAIPRPKTYLQDILVLLSERRIDDEDEEGKEGGSGRKRMLSVGIEACVYYVPSTSSGVLYVSKVDTSGHGSRPSAARTLVKSLVGYYCCEGGGGRGVMGRGVRQMWVHVFARAQGQYLFPNSSEYEGKRPLSDVRLCAWWRGVLGEVGREVEGGGEGGSRRVGMWYVLPGYGEVEAVRALDFASRGGGEEGRGVAVWASVRTEGDCSSVSDAAGIRGDRREEDESGALYTVVRGRSKVAVHGRDGVHDGGGGSRCAEPETREEGGEQRQPWWWWWWWWWIGCGREWEGVGGAGGRERGRILGADVVSTGVRRGRGDGVLHARDRVDRAGGGDGWGGGGGGGRSERGGGGGGVWEGGEASDEDDVDRGRVFERGAGGVGDGDGGGGDPGTVRGSGGRIRGMCARTGCGQGRGRRGAGVENGEGGGEGADGEEAEEGGLVFLMREG